MIPRRARPPLLSLALLAAAATLADDTERTPYEKCVVGLRVTFQGWDEDRPWIKKQPEVRRASGVLIDAHRILTTADTLDNATLVQIETFGRTRDKRPRIERLDRTVNLALLVVDEAGTLDGLAPISLASRTPTSGTLHTARWRSQQLEAAASRIIRVEVARAGGDVAHAVLRMRTDMAGGGWSEPVFDGETLVGLTVSQTAEGESRAIPVEILAAFLEREAAGASPGFATLGVQWQTNRDPAVSRFLGQAGEPQGILVRRVPWGSSGCGALEPRDILLAMAGQPIDAEGFHRHPWLGRIGIDHLLAERFRPGDRVPVRVLRGGQELELVLTARSYPAGLDLIPVRRSGPPPYVIVGGLVVRELDVPYLRTWGKEWTKDAPDSLLSRYSYESEAQTPQRRRIVLISSVLPAACNVGYQDLRDVVIERVNDRPIGRIEDVVDALGHPLDDFHVIELSPGAPRGRIVFDAATLDAATAAILEEYRVPSIRRSREEPLPEGGGDCADDF